MLLRTLKRARLVPAVLALGLVLVAAPAFAAPQPQPDAQPQGPVIDGADAARPAAAPKPAANPDQAPMLVVENAEKTARLFFLQPAGKPPADGRPTIVIVPGLGCQPQDYTEVSGYLLAKGYNVAVFETQGNQEMEGKVWDKRLSEVTDELLAHNKEPRSPLHGVVNEAELGIVGHSLGGSVATFAAARDPRFKALVTFGPGGKDQSFLQEARNVQGATLAIDGSLDRMTPPDQAGGVVVERSASPFKAQIVVKGGAHANSVGDYNADYIRGSLQLIPEVKYVGFFPIVTWSYGFPVIKEIKPIPGPEQRAIGFRYLGAWLDKFVAGKNTSVDFAKLAADEVKSGLLTEATVSPEAAQALEPAAAKTTRGRAAKPAATDEIDAALMERIKARGAQEPRDGIVDGLVKAGAERERGGRGAEGR